MQAWNITVVQPTVKPVFKGDGPLRLDALLLGVGESLRWPELGANSCFVIPLGAPAATVRDAAAA